MAELNKEFDVAKPSPLYGPRSDANSFPMPFPDEQREPVLPRCCWPGCKQEAWAVLCFAHAIDVYGLVRRVLVAQDERIEAELRARDIPTEPLQSQGPQCQPYVYYLMLSPATVKIGTTINLRRRISGLRSELQYVVAIERGGVKLEHQRHKEFAEERFGKREDFQLSERLKQHIEALQPRRDELVRLAMAPTTK